LQVCKFFRNRKQKFSQYFFVGLYNLLGLYLSGDRYLRKSFPASGGGANKKLCSALQDFLFALPIFRAFVMAVFLGLCSALGSPEKTAMTAHKHEVSIFCMDMGRGDRYSQTNFARLRIEDSHRLTEETPTGR